MLKKRVIFTLLYCDGSYMLSRNFRLQKVGDLHWLKENYNFSQISFFIDELIVINISRSHNNQKSFLLDLEKLSKDCFLPISAGGGIRSPNTAKDLFNSGADKILFNTAIFLNPELIQNLVKKFGQQCIVASIDLKKNKNGDYQIVVESGTKILSGEVSNLLKSLDTNSIGEIYLNSIDQDGTGQGYDLKMLNFLPKIWSFPVILAGGAGNNNHLQVGLNDERVDAVATANLFNFVGDGLKKAREAISLSGINLAHWPSVLELNDLIKKY